MKALKKVEEKIIVEGGLVEGEGYESGCYVRDLVLG
jgi:hypothetical protein